MNSGSGSTSTTSTTIAALNGPAIVQRGSRRRKTKTGATAATRSTIAAEASLTGIPGRITTLATRSAKAPGDR
jgi:hypothetical protein